VALGDLRAIVEEAGVHLADPWLALHRLAVALDVLWGGWVLHVDTASDGHVGSFSANGDHLSSRPDVGDGVLL